MVFESNTDKESSSERVTGHKYEQPGNYGVPRRNPHMSDLRPVVCTELPAFLPQKVSKSHAGSVEGFLHPEHYLLLGALSHLLAIRGVSRDGPALITMTV